MPSSRPALLLGSLSTLADTSELQRDAFNRAFAEHGLDWSWSQDEYAELLRGNGGQQRVADEARRRGQEVDAAAVHATKSRLFQETLRSSRLEPRPGVAETLAAVREDGWSRALVTTTSPENVAALFVALGGTVSADDLDLVVDLTQVDAPKPDPAAYRFALDKLGLEPGSAVAVEDNTGGVAAAHAAGVPVLAMPNVNTARHDFHLAARVVDRLDPADVRALVHG